MRYFVNHKNQNTMNIYRINTTAYEEEDFFLMTTLTEEQIIKVIKPIVTAERNGVEYYDNDTLVEALNVKYPSSQTYMYADFEIISI